MIRFIDQFYVFLTLIFIFQQESVENMNTLNNNVDDVVECPLCMEPLEVDDLNFFPCTCGYQVRIF